MVESTAWNDPQRIEYYYKTIEELRREDVEILRGWINTQDHLPKPSTDVILISALHSCYFDIDASKECLNKFFVYRARIPELFDDRNPLREDIQLQLPRSFRTILPRRTKENYDILFTRILETSNYNPTVEMKIVDMMTTLQYFQRGFPEGSVIIVDSSTISFGLIFRMNIGLCRRYVNYLQDAAPARVKAVHVINVNTLTEKLFNLFKPMLKTHIKDIIHLHAGVDSLFDKIPQELLPSEFGGNQGTITDLQKAMMSNLMDNVDFFRQDDALKADLSLIP